MASGDRRLMPGPIWKRSASWRLNVEAVARPSEIGRDRSPSMRDGRAVEQHLLDPHMIVKPFEVAQPRHGAGDVAMHGRRAVAGEIDVMRFAQRRDARGSR